MKVRILRDTIVRFPKGAEIEVSEAEADRLCALRNAEKIESETGTKPAAKKTAKKG